MFQFISPQCFADLRVSLSGSVSQAKNITHILKFIVPIDPISLKSWPNANFSKCNVWHERETEKERERRHKERERERGGRVQPVNQIFKLIHILPKHRFDYFA